MPKEKISDDHMTGWYTEVSWRRQECVCPCGEIWSADTPKGEQCPGCQRVVTPTSGHVQLASVNPTSPFVFPANPRAPEDEPAEPFDGWRVTLDADQIDYLMAVLRKAKRQAYPQPTHPGGVVTVVESILSPLTNDQVQLMVSQVARRGNLR